MLEVVATYVVVLGCLNLADIISFLGDYTGYDIQVGHDGGVWVWLHNSLHYAISDMATQRSVNRRTISADILGYTPSLVVWHNIFCWRGFNNAYTISVCTCNYSYVVGVWNARLE